MNKAGKIAIISALGVAVVVVVALKQNNKVDSRLAVVEPPGNVVAAPRAQEAGNAQSDASMALPRLVDLGAGKCIPCKMMAPILEELRQEYAGRLRVDVFDIEENPDLVAEYKVWVIPTQIFFDASGTELFRHEGFISKEDILAKWKELGVELVKRR
ncbi:MAG: thioredoxin family protein [Planctomycetota bacterium]|jgi:thioredoxin 1